MWKICRTESRNVDKICRGKTVVPSNTAVIIDKSVQTMTACSHMKDHRVTLNQSTITNGCRPGTVRQTKTQLYTHQYSQVPSSNNSCWHCEISALNTKEITNHVLITQRSTRMQVPTIELRYPVKICIIESKVLHDDSQLTDPSV